MGNTVAITTDFYCLTSPQQRQILEACMLCESLTWATVSTLASPAIKEQQFLANLVESHKNGTVVLPTTPPPNQDANKRPKITVTPAKNPVGFPGFANTDAR